MSITKPSLKRVIFESKMISTQLSIIAKENYGNYIYAGREYREYTLLSKSNLDKEKGVLYIKYFDYSDIDEKEPGLIGEKDKQSTEKFLKIFIPLIKEKDIKEFLKDFQFRLLAMGNNDKRL